MPLQILGLNHNTAPVEIREQVAFAGDEVSHALERLTALDGVEEAVLLSTCNRTEFYVIGEDAGRERLKQWLHDDRRLGDNFAESLFMLDDEEAIRHIFRVACGLDSMVLGEPQILGQLKDAYRYAQDADTLGGNLGRLFQHTFAVAKKIRTDTEIGASPVSVASAAVNLAQQFFSGFKKHTALLVGAGVTIELVAKHLVSHDIGRLFVANRSVERAQKLAGQFGGFALPLSEIEGTLPEADILITSTAATEPVVTTQQIANALKARTKSSFRVRAIARRRRSRHIDFSMKKSGAMQRSNVPSRSHQLSQHCARATKRCASRSPTRRASAWLKVSLPRMPSSLLPLR